MKIIKYTNNKDFTFNHDTKDLHYGAFKLNDKGKIIKYIDANGDKQTILIGADFFNLFKHLNFNEFYDIFRRGVMKDDLNHIFEYTFDSTKIKLHMKKAITDEFYWIFVKTI